MRSLLAIVSLELKALVRSKAVAMLTGASVLWMLAFPHLVKGDGTPEGARELYVHFSLGGVFALLVVALLASATGSLARERAEKRLQLTMVRPVRGTALVFGKIAAHVAVGAFVLAVACAILAWKADCSRPCSHVLSPVLPSPREEAQAMYEAAMKDPRTPEAVRRTKKETVLRFLANRAIDRYQAIATNATASWTFDTAALAARPAALAVRMRFTNQYEMRDEVRGEFALGGFRGGVSNITQAVLKVPLHAADGGLAGSTLTFRNDGASSLMLRPRKDINLLLPADSFARNLVRAYAELVAILALLVSAGLFLSAGLGRPVALFVAFVALVVSEMSPSVIEQYPDELETDRIDRIGLVVTRMAAEVTRPVSSASPLEALSKDECVEPGAAARLVLIDLLAVPLLLSLAGALVLPRKQDDVA